MKPLYSVNIPTDDGEKNISVFCSDILSFDKPIDILTTSAYYRSYNPVPGTMFHALHQVNIPVYLLAQSPEIDLRSLGNVWLSKPLKNTGLAVQRIGCVELTSKAYFWENLSANIVNETEMLKSIKAYFQMLDVAAVCGVPMQTIAIPVLGSGRQNIASDLILIPLLNECMEFLKRNSSARQIFFVERNPQKAMRVAELLSNSYALLQEQQLQKAAQQAKTERKTMAFISYSSPDRNVADNLCAKLEAKGVQVWYAPRNVNGPYATAIAQAISQATHFIVILSKNSMTSEHVLNEIDLAFKKLPNHIRFNPLRIDTQEFAPAFDYYLSRQHWMDAFIPPLEQRLKEFVEHFVDGL